VIAPMIAVTEMDPATLTIGTRLVQLGAYDDVATARKEWDKLAGQFGELLSGKARVVQSAQSGGRTFFRLRAHGFADEDDARRFCSALLAENAACIPVAVR
ncbi:MAG: SPOR domain-containing protein, partial [Paracoccaceae bacterium]|nr:SPOR domain-containing protein [Paracoccaceae bacterium]